MSSPSTTAAASIVLLGNVGVGKSRFIKFVLLPQLTGRHDSLSESDAKRLKIGYGPAKVTTKSESYLCQGMNFMKGQLVQIIDTVGMDDEGFAHGVDESNIKAPQHSYIVLLSKMRYEVEKRSVAKTLGLHPNSPHIMWLASNGLTLQKQDSAEKDPNYVDDPHFPLPCGHFDIRKLTLSAPKDTSGKVVPGPPVPVPVSVPSVKMPVKSKKTHTPNRLSRSEQVTQLFFGNSPVDNKLVKTVFLLDLKVLRKQKTDDFDLSLVKKLIPTWQTVKTHRFLGDRYLNLYSAMYMAPNYHQAISLVNNEHLERVVRSIDGLPQYIEQLVCTHLRQESEQKDQCHDDELKSGERDHFALNKNGQLKDPLSAEKFADVIEAVFWLIMTKKENSAHFVKFWQSLTKVR